MSPALRELGLGPDADERAVKRAYAARLKATRPDTDPEGFQRLNAAYQAALAWVQSRSNVAYAPQSSASETETDAAADDVPLGAITQALSTDALFAMLESRTGETDEGMRGDAGDDTFGVTNSARIDTVLPEPLPTETIRFDLDAFFDDCIALASRGRDGELLGWLNAQPILWSLQHKAQIAQWLLGHLNEHRPAIEARRFDVLAEFFGLLDLHSGYDAYAIQRLRHRLHLAWEIRTSQLHALAQRGQPDGGSHAADVRQTRRILKQLRRPLNTTQAMFAGLMPMYPSAMRRFLYRLDFGNIDDLPPPIEPQQVAFWDAAGDRSRVSVPRLQIGAARCVAYSALAMLLVTLVQLMAPEAELHASAAIKTGTAVFAGISAGWIAWVGGQACLQWQCLPEDEEERFGRLRRASIPTFALIAFALELALDWDIAAAVISVWTFLLAWQRYRQRNGPLFGFA
ncbi:MAG: J domain-containing protein, partial [Lysobacteraceae bacterium]